MTEDSMAMIKCPDCGSNVSDRAQACPVCGFPIQEEVQRIKEETDAKSDTALYVKYTEKELAAILIKALRDDDYASVNGICSAFDNLYPESIYTEVLRIAKDKYKEEKRKNEYIIKNFELLINYLDYPIDENGYYDWIDDVNKRWHRGYYQETDEIVSKMSFNTKTGKFEEVNKWWKNEGTFSVCE